MTVAVANPQDLRLAIVGFGRAGQARARAIEALSGVALAGVVRREPGAADLASMLAEPTLDAVLVCTPNLLHAETVARCLDAGKHVAVEFPLAASRAEAEVLFERARTGDRVLHVEHIELLSPSQLEQRGQVARMGTLRSGCLRFTGGSKGWIGDTSLAGSPALRAIARLHRLVDLFGKAEVTDADLKSDGSEYQLQVELRFLSGGTAILEEQRGPDVSRSTDWDFECARGALGNPEAANSKGLFQQDLEVFLGRIQGTQQSYVDDVRVLHVLELVEAIERLTQAE